MLVLRLAALLAVVALLFDVQSPPYNARVLRETRGQTFNYVEWEVGAILSKLHQELFGYHAYIPEEQRRAFVLDYFDLRGRLFALEGQIENNPTPAAALIPQRDALRQALNRRQALAEHIIEGQVSAILQAEGFGLGGQILPPVTMHFLTIPDVLIVSPRDEIRTAMTVTLQPMGFEERVLLESQIAAAVPDQAVWITPIGGVGVYPAMVRETDRAVVAFEITAHEWLHHYLVFFPLGYHYYTHPDTRIINETSATLFGNEIGNKVITRFYADDLAAGRVYLQDAPDYRALLAAVAPPLEDTVLLQDHRLLADFLLVAGRAEAAQLVLDLHGRWGGIIAPPYPNRKPPDRAAWISHTRVTVDYLLGLGMVEAAEWSMENGRQHSGLRVLNQAWFAFNAGYQDNPVVTQQADGTSVITTSGGGGDPIGAAIYEIRARAGSLQAFVEIMRGITTREELQSALQTLRGES